MNKKKFTPAFHFSVLFAFLTLTFDACQHKNKTSEKLGRSGLTQRTEYLQTNLKRYQDKGVLIGQVYGTLQGVGWRGDNLRSDILSITGELPAANGYMLAGLEQGHARNQDSIDFSLIRKDAVRFFKKGGLLLLSWTAPDPHGNEETLQQWIKKTASWIGNLKDQYGKKVPIVLFLYPQTGSTWYDELSADEYKHLFRQTIEWMKDEQLDNVLFGYSTELGTFNEIADYIPEKDIGLVNISLTLTNAEKNLKKQLTDTEERLNVFTRFAHEKKLLIGLTPHIDNRTDAPIYSEVILPLIKNKNISYVLFSSNGGTPADGHYSTPYPGSHQEIINDFLNLYNDDSTIFIKQLNGLYVDWNK